MHGRYMRHDRTPSYPYERELVSTSKLLLFFITLTYFVGVGIGGYVVIEILHSYPDSAVSALIAMFSFIGGATGITIAFYSWKSKNENVLKISGSGGTESDE